MEQLFNDPYVWFDAWLDEAKANGMPDPNAMCLSTVGEDGMPSSRMVLLKERTPDGFVFYTNLESHKGRELRDHPKACLLFYWREFNRQIRVEGQVFQVDDATADAYFSTRPRGSQKPPRGPPKGGRTRTRRRVEEGRSHRGGHQKVAAPAADAASRKAKATARWSSRRGGRTRTTAAAKRHKQRGP